MMMMRSVVIAVVIAVVTAVWTVSGTVVSALCALSSTVLVTVTEPGVHVHVRPMNLRGLPLTPVYSTSPENVIGLLINYLTT